MKIAIESSSLTGPQQYRGVGSYTKHLLESLRIYEPSHTYISFIKGEKIPKADVIHYPYFDPFFLTLPIRKDRSTVVTVHDVIPLSYPDKFPRGIWGEIKWQIQKLSLRRACDILTDSKASKKDIQNVTGIISSKIHVVYLAPSPLFKPVEAKDTLRSVMKKHRLPQRFLLYVGDVNWNKNIPGLLNAYAVFRSRNNDIKLVLVGKSFLDTSLAEVTEINKTVQELGLETHVVRPGFVEAEDLPAIYSSSLLYIQPSIAEGFGLPALEAMACNCRVVTSFASSLSEIAGPAILCDPHSSESIVKSIEAALAIPATLWMKNAQAWVRKFSWKNVAKETVYVYEKAACVQL